MRYWECILDTPSEEIDERCDELSGLGVGGFVVENEEDFRNFLENNHQYWDYVDQELENQFAGVSRLKFYLTDDTDGLSVLQQVRARYPGVTVSAVEDSDWENNWREYYKPIEVGERLVVVPEWEEIPAGGRLPLRLDPGLIFRNRQPRHDADVPRGAGGIRRAREARSGSGLWQRYPRDRRAGPWLRQLPRL